MIELSKRLQAVADFVTPSECIVDIGTDHAYIPIYLVEKNYTNKAIAMDVNEGPLKKAREHISSAGLEDRIECRLSDGLRNLGENEAKCAIIAGMGGALIIRILQDGERQALNLKELILQPQSEISKVRAFLLEQGYQIQLEEMVLEEGKYYPMMKVIPLVNKHEKETWNHIELKYGKLLLQNRHPILKKYLEKEERLKLEIYNKLEAQQGENIQKRKGELAIELEYIKKGLEYYAV